MNIFVKDGFYKGEFTVENGVFSEVRILGECDRNDPDYVLPGLIDIHSHGRVGEDFSFAGEDELRTLLLSYAKCGVTGVLATTMTNKRSEVEKSILAAAKHMKYPETGEARCLGVNMEGPFLGRDKKGAHDEQYLSDFDKKWLDSVIETSNNNIRIITVDPRLPESEAFIGYCRSKGIVVSLGHTSADYETAVKACDAGANHVTHLFNAMNPLLHRAPGLIGAAFDRGMYCEIISDGIHVDPALVRMWFKLMPERMVLISDSMQAAGLSDGSYSLGGLDVNVVKGKATLADGTIAGSTTNVYAAMRKAIEFGVPVKDAILAASYNPAVSVNLENKVGSIQKGNFADYLLTDSELNLREVFINGRTI